MKENASRPENQQIADAEVAESIARASHRDRSEAIKESKLAEFAEEFGNLRSVAHHKQTAHDVTTRAEQKEQWMEEILALKKLDRPQLETLRQELFERCVVLGEELGALQQSLTKQSGDEKTITEKRIVSLDNEVSRVHKKVVIIYDILAGTPEEAWDKRFLDPTL